MNELKVQKIVRDVIDLEYSHIATNIQSTLAPLWKRIIALEDEVKEIYMLMEPESLQCESEHHNGEPCLLPINAMVLNTRFFYTGEKRQTTEGEYYVHPDTHDIRKSRNRPVYILRAEPLPKCEECVMWDGDNCIHENNPRVCTAFAAPRKSKEEEWVMSANGQGVPFQWDNKCEGKNFIADVRPAVATNWIREIGNEKYIAVKNRIETVNLYGDNFTYTNIPIAFVEQLGIPIMPESEYKRLCVDEKFPWGEKGNDHKENR